MNLPGYTITEQVARSVSHFQRQQTGQAPKSVTVVLSEGTLVITLLQALTSAEKELSRTDAGIAQIREYHLDLLAGSFGPLRAEIERLAGVTLHEAVAEVEPTTGTVIFVFTTGNMVQVFQLAGGLSSETWIGSEEDSHNSVA